MIFVTVGTHEQPFNRLVKAVDDLKLSGQITEEVFVQTGYSTYIPKACEHKDFISMKQMNQYMEEASIIITHGGPSSFIMALQHNKVPIVVPRQAKFNEHVNDHQVTFCQELTKKGFPIIIASETEHLLELIAPITQNHNYGEITLNNSKFIAQFKTIISDLILS